MRTSCLKLSPAIVLYLLPMFAYADWETNPATNDVMVVHSGNQDYLHPISDGSGGAFVAWGDTRDLGTTGYDIYIQRISGTGDELWTTDGIAVCTETGTQHYPYLVSDGGSGVIIFWHDNRTGSTQTDIYAQKYDANGNEQWTAGGKGVVTGTSKQTYWYSHYTFHNFCMEDGSGGAYVAYTDNSPGNKDVCIQRINSSGNAVWGSPVFMSSSSYDDQAQRIISDGSGGAIVAWETLGAAGANSVYAQRINSSGTIQWTSGGVLVADAANTPSPSKPGDPEIVSDEAGGAIIVYNSYSGVSLGDLYMQRLDASGSLLWSHGPGYGGYVLANASHMEQNWKIMSDGNGDYFIVWGDGRNFATTDYDIYGQKIDVDGSELWSAGGLVLNNLTDYQGVPDLLVDGDGNLLMAWQDNRNSGTTGADIYGIKVDTDGNVDASWTSTGNAFCTATGDQYNPHLLPSGSTGFITMWTDLRTLGTTGMDIFGSFVNFDDGLLGGPGTLPVVYSNISAALVGNDKIEVKWSTSEEVDNDYFVVEKSQDGLNFIEIGIIDGNGTTERQKDYQFTDYNPHFGVNYYRLKQVDFDGVFEYSKIIPVKMELLMQISTYPNPAKTQFRVRVPYEATHLELYNIMGENTLLSPVLTNGEFYFDTQRLSRGMYVLKVYAQNTEQSVKVMIE